MKRIVFNHDEDDVLKALGFASPEEANEVTNDDNNPDCHKMRFAAAVFNSDVTMILALWGAVISKKDLVPQATANLEIIFDSMTEEDLKRMDEKVMMFDAERRKVTAEEAVKILENMEMAETKEVKGV